MKTSLVILVAVLSIVLSVDAMYYTAKFKQDEKKEIRKVWNICDSPRENNDIR